MKTILTLLTCGAALALSSCDYLSCISAEKPEECAIGRALERVVTHLADAKNIDSQEKAEKFADNWEEVQKIISNAQAFGVDVPENVKKAYNDTLDRIVKHNYFDSPTLKTAMANAQYIK